MWNQTYPSSALIYVTSLQGFDWVSDQLLRDLESESAPSRWAIGSFESKWTHTNAYKCIQTHTNQSAPISSFRKELILLNRNPVGNTVSFAESRCACPALCPRARAIVSLSAVNDGWHGGCQPSAALLLEWRLTSLQRGFLITANLCQPSARKAEDTMLGIVHRRWISQDSELYVKKKDIMKRGNI